MCTAAPQGKKLSWWSGLRGSSSCSALPVLQGVGCREKEEQCSALDASKSQDCCHTVGDSVTQCQSTRRKTACSLLNVQRLSSPAVRLLLESLGSFSIFMFKTGMSLHPSLNPGSHCSLPLCQLQIDNLRNLFVDLAKQMPSRTEVPSLLADGHLAAEVES